PCQRSISFLPRGCPPRRTVGCVRIHREISWRRPSSASLPRRLGSRCRGRNVRRPVRSLRIQELSLSWRFLLQQHDTPPKGVPQEELTRPGVNLTRQMSDGKIAGMATALAELRQADSNLRQLARKAM